MRKLSKYLTFFVISTMLFSCAKQEIFGEYRTNFNTYGMFAKSLTLDCEGKAVMNFRGDLMNDNSLGRYEVKEDTLIIHFDSLKGQRYEGDLSFIIQGNKLLNVPFPKAEYDRLVQQLKGNDTIKILSYKKLNKMMSLSPANFKGKMKKQYFKKVKEIDCK